jgi:hypothetical protein
LLSLLLAAFLAACGGDSSGPSARVAQIVLTASDSTLAVTDTALLDLIAFDDAGNVLIPADGSTTISHATFSTAPAGVVVASGIYAVATARGTTRLTATLEGKTSSVSIAVAGVVHRAPITASETWHAADNPHYVRTNLHVGGSGPVTLTLEPGVQVRFSVYAGLTFDAPASVLNAQGTAAAPISFTADSAAVTQANPIKGFWAGVLISTTQSELHHVVMSDCGRDLYLVTPYFGACLVLADLFGDHPRPVLQDVTIKDFGITGLLLQNGGGVGATSANLTIQGGGPFYFGGGGLPIFAAPNEVGTIPTTTTLTGNLSNEIRVGILPQIGGGAFGDSVIRSSQTWANLGVPYNVDLTLRISGSNTPVLTLSPGVSVQFARFTGLLVGRDGPGGLVAVGTVGSPILFTSQDAFKYADSWNGLVFGQSVTPQTRLDHTTIEWGGGFNATFQWNGQLVVEQNGLDSLVKNSTIRESGYCGVLRAWTASATNTDYTTAGLNNTFSNNRSGDQCGP